MQIKITFRIAIIKKARNNKCWQRGEKRELLCTVGGIKIGATNKENNMDIFKNNSLKIELLCDPEILLLGIYPEEMKSLSYNDISMTIFMEALFAIVKTWKQSKHAWHTHVHIHNGIVFSHGKEWDLATTCMDLEDIMLNEINLTKKEKYHMISLICGMYPLQKNKTLNSKDPEDR